MSETKINLKKNICLSDLIMLLLALQCLLKLFIHDLKLTNDLLFFLLLKISTSFEDFLELLSLKFLLLFDLYFLVFLSFLNTLSELDELILEFLFLFGMLLQGNIHISLQCAFFFHGSNSLSLSLIF